MTVRERTVTLASMQLSSTFFTSFSTSTFEETFKSFIDEELGFLPEGAQSLTSTICEQPGPLPITA